MKSVAKEVGEVVGWRDSMRMKGRLIFTIKVFSDRILCNKDTTLPTQRYLVAKLLMDILQQVFTKF